MGYKARVAGFRKREREEEETVDLGDEVVLLYETARAIKVEIDGDEKWIPKSLLRDGSTVQDQAPRWGAKGTLVVPLWFAKKEELVE